MRKLRSRGQDFVTIRKENLLYVDKTRYVYKLIRSMGCYFLSRPRSFGKSLLVEAMAEALKGNRELFDGLWLGSSDYDFKKYPVVKVTMTGASQTREQLEASIMRELWNAALSNGLVLEGGTPDLAIKRLVRDLNHSTGERVAVLVDDCDHPVRSNLSDIRQAAINRDALHPFYTALKTLADDGQLRLLFVTGEIKFAQASGFPGFNDLADLTLNPDFNGVCGFTSEEFDAYLAYHLPDVLEYDQAEGFIEASATLEDLRAQVLDYYGGYSWGGKGRVLNPLATICFFQHKVLLPFWYDSTIQTFLLEFIEKNPDEYMGYSSQILNVTDLNIDVANLDLTPLLFQIGYMAIERQTDACYYDLITPNRGVELSFNDYIAIFLTGQEAERITGLADKIRAALADFDSKALGEALGLVFNWVSRHEGPALEGFHLAHFFAVLKAMGLKVAAEVSESEGRFDVVLPGPPETVFIGGVKRKEYARPTTTWSRPTGRKRRLTAKREASAFKKDEEATVRRLALEALGEAKAHIERRRHEAVFQDERRVVKGLAIGLVGRNHLKAEIY